MRVQRLVMPGSGTESWTLLGDDGLPVEPVERFLAYLGAIERSPNTVKAYAHDLKDWFVFLGGRGVDWAAVTLEDVAAFAAWLRLPPAGRGGLVAVLPSAETYCSAASVNRKLGFESLQPALHQFRGAPVQLVGAPFDVGEHVDDPGQVLQIVAAAVPGRGRIRWSIAVCRLDDRRRLRRGHFGFRVDG